MPPALLPGLLHELPVAYPLSYKDDTAGLTEVSCHTVDYRSIAQMYNLKYWQDILREIGTNYEYDENACRIYTIKEAEEITGEKCKIIKSTILSDSEIKKE